MHHGMVVVAAYGRSTPGTGEQVEDQIERTARIRSAVEEVPEEREGCFRPVRSRIDLRDELFQLGALTVEVTDDDHGVLQARRKFHLTSFRAAAGRWGRRLQQPAACILDPVSVPLAAVLVLVLLHVGRKVRLGQKKRTQQPPLFVDIAEVGDAVLLLADA